ncbi:YtxH domain-containing protein [Tuberibacillus sp. Marseille-P3662]|uniref:YtxH domain-containing protein n=1 Tax=Tuberibacillus sp. Marseille-P3662 TaxID=1965358 RepID=UPI000A1CD3BC|nr:YtxH domain-containing protein [Tuberibacillus sp. Marseille-P3662]
MSKFKSYLYGFTAGGLAAGITVLLNTPKPGKEVRDNLQNKAESVRDTVNDFRNTTDSVKAYVDDFKNNQLTTIQATAKDIKGIVETWQRDIQPNIEHIRQDLKDMQSESRNLNQENHEPENDAD